MNAWYELETSEGKRLIVAYKAKKTEIGAELAPIMDYISEFNQEESERYHKNHKEFEFLVDDEDPAGEFKKRTTDVILEYLDSDRRMMLSDFVFDGEIQVDEREDGSFRIEIYLYDISGRPVHIGYVPEKLHDEMEDFLEYGIDYEIRMLASGYGFGKRKTYIIRALLIFDRR